MKLPHPILMIEKTSNNMEGAPVKTSRLRRLRRLVPDMAYNTRLALGMFGFLIVAMFVIALAVPLSRRHSSRHVITFNGKISAKVLIELKAKSASSLEYRIFHRGFNLLCSWPWGVWDHFVSARQHLCCESHCLRCGRQRVES